MFCRVWLGGLVEPQPLGHELVVNFVGVYTTKRFIRKRLSFLDNYAYSQVFLVLFVL